MKIIIYKKFYNKRIFRKIIFLKFLWYFSSFIIANAACWTSDLSEEDQLAMARKTFEDGVFSASSETAKCYLDEFKNGKAREEMFFIRAEALRKGGDIKGSIKAYEELKKNFPKSKSYLDNAMLQQGISLTTNKNYPLAISTLKSLLKDYPKSKFRHEANYWLGYNLAFSADLMRKNNNKKAKNEYKASIKHLSKGNPKSLTQKQKQKRFYLIGHAWWILGEISNSANAWNNYIKELKYTNPEKALKIKFKLATRFQKDKKFSESEKWFAKIITENKKSKLAIESSFWRAEMAYAATLNKNKVISNKNSRRIVNYYNSYLEKKDEKHKALTFFRIGTLEQNFRPIKSISAFKNYLKTKDKLFSNEVHYRLAHLYINTKQPQKAIQIFESYLNTGDTFYANEVKYQLGYLYIDTKQPQKAIQIFENYLSIKNIQNSSEIQIRLGYLYIDTNQKDKAIKIFKKYLSSGDKDNFSEIQVRLGYLYIDTNQKDKAIKIFKKYLDGENKNFEADVQIRLGYLYIERKETKNAIELFEKYLAGDKKENFLEIKFRLAYLYIETKQDFLAIGLLEQLRNNPEFQQNKELLQTLMVLYRDNVSEGKFVKFLTEVRSDQKLEENIRREFQIELIFAYYQQKKCDDLIMEINNKPGFLQKIKNSHPQEWQHLMFLKGSCFMITKKWTNARNIFRQTKDSKKYRTQSIEMLLEAYRQLEDWKGITWEFQEIFDRNSPQMTIPYFQLWMYAAQKRKDFQRLDRIKIISDRWKEIFPEDNQNLSNINQYLSTAQIQELSKQGKWLEISNYIRKEVKSGNINLDEQIFSQLLYSEQKLENWNGVLTAYTLLSIYDQTEVEKLDALINQAKAAEKLGKKELAKEYYIKALKITPENDYEKNTQTEIREYLTVGIFQNLIKKKEWSKISKMIHQEVKENKRILDDKNFEFLLFVENKRKGKSKYNAILAAYKLLSKSNNEKANTVEALIDQAKAAEELRKKKLALKYFRKASKKIREEVNSKKRTLDDKNFKLLLFTENKKPAREKYNGILDAYSLLSKFDNKKTLTVESLIDQGYAAEKLGGYKRAKGYYNSALKKVPDKKIDLALQLIGELVRLYERSKDFKSLINIYKRAYDLLKKNSRPKKEYQTYAYLIGYYYSTQLKENKKSRTWMLRADGGGSSNHELEAGFWIAQIDIKAKKPEKAFKRLKELAGRKISKNSAIYSQIHFEIGTIFHQKEKWKSALMHFRLVTKANPPMNFKQLKMDAKQNVKEIDNYLKSIQASE